MQLSRLQRLALTWLLLSAGLCLYLFGASRHAVEQDAVKSVRQHLLLTLGESQFSSAQNRVNDHRAIQRVGQQVNDALQGIVGSRWYGAQQDCVVQLQKVDDVFIEDVPMPKRVTFGLLRNQVQREVTLGISCSRNWGVALGVCVLLGLLFFAIASLLPPPLSKEHRYWINYLLSRGYSGQQAFEISSAYDSARLTLNAAQMHCLEELHDSEQKNFSAVMEVVSDARVAALEGDALDWLLLGLARDPQDLEGALELASAGDSIVIDLNEMTLRLHGLEIPMSRTPLFYYAWYAMSRLNTDGWLTNPASNRPDLSRGVELASLMSAYDGHARAINDLEQSGLKARTLDQNRSKIKEDLVAVLGEKLASGYLFEASKHPDGVLMRYRLCLEASQIHIVM